MPLPWCQAEGLGGVDEISWNQKAEVTSDGKKGVMMSIKQNQSCLVIVATKQ